MEKTYQPDNIEAHWNYFWETQKLFKPSDKNKSFCIMLPPPNVTGTLHMGHGFQHTLMDAIIRRQRMLAKNVLWQPGTDHAGIATQMVVERLLAKQGMTRTELGREKFLEKAWEWRDQSGSIITQQIRRLGASLDWDRFHFSMDPQINHATYEAFIRLYQDKLIYRGKRLVNWDPQLNTAVSDLEVINKTESGKLWYIRYPLTNGKDHIMVATTRPETVLGDVAVAVHPEDERYQKLIGLCIKHPLTAKEIPIIADEAVSQEFGTGCVKITPAHDFNDYEIGQRHQLEMINIFTPTAHLNNEVPLAYQGLDRLSAREKIIADLQALNLIEKIESHTLNIPYADRSGVIIEPMLTDQWFINMKAMAEQAIKVVNSGEIQFIPHNWTKTYIQWLEQIQDWCISRQLWWGHRIPVWYDEQGNHYAGFDESDVRTRYQLSDHISLRQDEDVLDTWFTAALYPFSTLGWPEQTEDLQTFYPTDVLVTGFDIIFFWVARMVMMGLKLVGRIPFKQVYITGLIRDSQGQKMSKTKGNILDPIDLIDGIDLETLIRKRLDGLILPHLANEIEKTTRQEFPNGIPPFGADALRFTFCALANTGRDINFDMGRIAGYRNFCNKLWNAARFVLMHTEQENCSTDNLEYSQADRWINHQLQYTIEQVNKFFEQYRFDLIAQALYEFTWNNYCDWYLELAKCLLTDPMATKNQKNAARYTLLSILETLLRLLHPVIPFITEEIWQKVAPLLNKENNSIMSAPYPQYDAKQIDAKAAEEIEWLQAVVNSIRNIRSEMNVSPAKKILVLLSKGNELDQKRFSGNKKYIQSLAQISEIDWLPVNQTCPASATAVVENLEIYIPLAGLIDKEAEVARLQKSMQKLEKEYEKSSQKLNNVNYLQKAPKEVVEKEQQNLLDTKNKLEKLKEQCERIGTLS